MKMEIRELLKDYKKVKTFSGFDERITEVYIDIDHATLYRKIEAESDSTDICDYILLSTSRHRELCDFIIKPYMDYKNYAEYIARFPYNRLIRKLL